MAKVFYTADGENYCSDIPAQVIIQTSDYEGLAEWIAEHYEYKEVEIKGIVDNF